jgi:hypothetical protein
MNSSGELHGRWIREACSSLEEFNSHQVFNHIKERKRKNIPSRGYIASALRIMSAKGIIEELGFDTIQPMHGNQHKTLCKRYRWLT